MYVRTFLRALLIRGAVASVCSEPPVIEHATNPGVCVNTSGGAECEGVYCDNRYLYPFGSGPVCDNETLEWQEPTPKCLTPAEISCGVHLTCEACSAKTSCTWCDARAACVPGTAAGPSRNETCPEGPHFYSRCLAAAPAAGASLHVDVVNASEQIPHLAHCFAECGPGGCAWDDAACSPIDYPLPSPSQRLNDSDCSPWAHQEIGPQNETLCVCPLGSGGPACDEPLCGPCGGNASCAFQEVLIEPLFLPSEDQYFARVAACV